MNNNIEKFYKFEIENELLSYKYNDFPIWLFVREFIYLSIFQQSNVSDSFKKASGDYSFSIKNIFKIIYNSFTSFIQFYFKTNKTSDILALSSPFDRKCINNLNISLYYDSLFDKLEMDGISCNLLLFNSQDSQLKCDRVYKKERIIRGEWVYLPDIFQRFYKTKVYNKDINNKVIAYCNSLNLESDRINELINIMNSLIRRNVFRFKFVSKSISKISPKLLLINSASSPLIRIIINQVKKNGGIVVECQHSHIYPNHIGYNLKTIDSRYTPDYYALFSNYYGATLKRISNDNLKFFVIGNIHKHNNNRIRRFKDNTLLIISQPTIMHKIADFLNSDKNVDKFKITIKTHPRGLNEIDFYKKNLLNKNILLAYKGNILDYLFVNQYALGSYSTGIIEALESGNQVYLFDFPESDFFYDLLSNKIVTKVSNLSEIKAVKYNSTSQFNFNDTFSVDSFYNSINEISNKLNLFTDKVKVNN